MGSPLRQLLALTFLLMSPGLAAARPEAKASAAEEPAPEAPAPEAAAAPAAAEPAPADHAAAPAAAARQGVKTQADEGTRGFMGISAGLAFPKVGGFYAGEKATGPSIPVSADGMVSFMIQGTVWILNRPPVNLGLQIGPLGMVLGKLGRSGHVGVSSDKRDLNGMILPAISLLVAVPLRYFRPYFGIGPTWGFGFLRLEDEDFNTKAVFYGYRLVAGLEFYIVNKFGITMEYSLTRSAKKLTFSGGVDDSSAYTMKGVDFGALTFGLVIALPQPGHRARPKAAPADPDDGGRPRGEK